MKNEGSPAPNPGNTVDPYDPGNSKDQAYLSHSWDEAALDSFMEMANRDLVSIRESKSAIPEKTQLIAEICKLTVYDIEAIFYLIAYCIAINSEKGNALGQKIARTCNYFRSQPNRMISGFLIEHRVTTSLELQMTLGLEDYTISRAFKTLRNVGLIKKKGRVGSPYRARTERGAGVPLWGLLDAEPQDYIEAQRRYGRHVLGHDPHEEEQRRQEQAHLDALAARAEADQVQRYVEKIAPYLDPSHAAPTRVNRDIIESHMTEEGVPEPIWVQVREGAQRLCRRPQGERGR